MGQAIISKTPPLRVHVIKLMTGEASINPFIFYSHFSDQGHNPTLTAAVVQIDGSEKRLSLKISDLCKLKPNFQVRGLTRVDVYVPVETATALRDFIASNFGADASVSQSTSNPGDYVGGAGKLPEIGGSYLVNANSVVAVCSGFRATESGGGARLYCDNESPADGHIEMKGPEFHFGIPNLISSGVVVSSSAKPYNVPSVELKRDQTNPVYKAQGTIVVRFEPSQATQLAAVLEALYP